MKYVRAITAGLFLLTAAVWALTGVAFHAKSDKESPVITSEADSIQVSVAEGEKGLLKGLTAADNKDGDLTDKIMIGKQSKFVEKGKSEVTYLVFDSSNNVGSLTRKVEYTDYKSPVFHLSEPLVFDKDNPVSILDRLTATDCVQGDITDKIKIVSSDVDTKETGTYYMGVETSNIFGDVVSLKLPVNVVDMGHNAPQIHLSDYLVTVCVGESVDPYAYLQDVTLSDGTLTGTEAVWAENHVDTSEEGVSYILYYYTDGYGETGYTSLTVVVRE